MPKINDVGYGDFTKKKYEDLLIIFKYHLSVTKAVLEKNKYYSQSYRYIDLTAGPGIISSIGNGSPLLFVKSVVETKFDLPILMDLIEKNRKSVESLKKYFNDSILLPTNINPNSINFYEGRYEEQVKNIIKSNNNEFGLIFIDPTGQLPDLDSLRYSSLMRPKMEILIYISATNTKRQHPYSEIELLDCIRSINKKNWFIRKAYKRDKFQFTFLLGTNADDLFRDYPSISFYSINSDIGKEILNKLNLTKDKYIKIIQPGLPNI